MSLVVKIILQIASVLIAQVAAYFINQCPEIPDFPGKRWLLGRLILWLTLLVVVVQVFVESKGTDDIHAIWRFGGAALLLALTLDVWRLLISVRKVANGKTAVASDSWQQLRAGHPQTVRKRLIAKYHRRLRERLDYAVGEQSLINVVMRSDPAAVDKRGTAKDVVLKSLEVPKKRWSLAKILLGRRTQDIAPKETILETFDHEDIDGRLLILGAPGSGKTTTLLKLADALLDRAKDTKKIPYIFELSAWREDQQSIAEWLMAQLQFDYNIDPVVSKQWLRDGWLLPLLDGLDELEPKRQTLCVERINDFVQEIAGVQVVVCCRSKEYDEGNVRLRALNGALCLRPLDDGQIQTYFEDMGRPDIWQAIQREPGLNSLLKLPNESSLLYDEAEEDPPLRIPLVLQILAVAYDASDYSMSSKTDLFDAYVMQRLALETRTCDRQRVDRETTEKNWAYLHIDDEPEFIEVYQYLGWLAKHLDSTNSANVFLIEQLQLSCLTESEQHKYRLLVRLICSLIIFLMTTLILSLAIGFREGISSGLTLTLLVSLMGARSKRLDSINPVEGFSIPLANEGRTIDLTGLPDEIFQHCTSDLINGLKWGAIFGLTLGSFGAVLTGLTEIVTVETVIKNLLSGLRVGAILGLMLGFVSSFIKVVVGVMDYLKADLEVKELPNQGIWLSMRTFFWIVLVSCLYSIMLRVLALHTASEPEGLEILCFLIMYLGFVSGGGLPFIQHSILRFLLFRQGNIPWNYAKFLRYTTERGLTQQIGGRFRFIHRELLDHFAAMDVDTAKIL